MALVWLRRPAIGLEQGLAVGGDGVVHGVPVTVELAGHLFHRPSGADLERRPLGRSRREQAVLGRDAVIASTQLASTHSSLRQCIRCFFQVRRIGNP